MTMGASEREQWLALRVERLEAELAAKEGPKVRERTCTCGAAVLSRGSGRPRLYCGTECRKAAKLKQTAQSHARRRAIEREVQGGR